MFVKHVLKLLVSKSFPLFCFACVRWHASKYGDIFIKFDCVIRLVWFWSFLFYGLYVCYYDACLHECTVAAWLVFFKISEL